MATLTHSESRRLYSWWWDSHISPKNSKWLQENLADMDTNVKLMIKLLEEDADSFARRTEMYYKKRPELLKLVEEFYRAYRALAERYDHATGALRQAHKTMAEAFPNQFALIDDPPSVSASVEGEPHTPEMPAPARAFVEPDDLQKDPLSQSAHSHSSKRNGSFSEENDTLNIRKGLKQLNEMFTSGETTIKTKFAKVMIQEKEVGNEEGAHEKMRSLPEEVSQLSTDSLNLKSQIKSEVENEIHRLQRSLLRLETEKVTILLQYHNSLEQISNLEKEVSRAQVDSEKLKSEVLNTLSRLESAQGQCNQLETEKLALEMEHKVLAQQTNQQHHELHQKHDEVERLKCTMQEENIRYTQAAAALHSLEKLHTESLEKLRISEVEIQNQVELLRDMESRKHSLEEGIQQVKEDNSSLKKELKTTEDELEKLKMSIQHEHSLLVQAEEALQSLQKLHSQTQEEIKILMFDLQSKLEMLKDMELRGQSLEKKIQELSESNESLNNQVISSSLMINDLQLEILSLKETQLKLENEAAHCLHENKSLQQEVNYLKEGIANLDMEYQSVKDQIKAVGLNKESLHASIKELQDGNLELKVLCKRHENENTVLLAKLEQMERVIEKNTFLEASLSDASVDLEGLREKIRTLEESSESLNTKISDLVLENHSLVLQLETTSKNMEKLSDDNAFLGNALSEANVELEGLRGRLKSLEESSLYLLDENSNLQSEKNKLVLQVENIHNSLEDMKRSYAELDDKHLNLEQEKESTLLLVSELQNLLKLEKQGHEAFILSSNNQQATLTDMINLLEKEGRIRNEELESTRHELLNSRIEAFMFQRCLLDSKMSCCSYLSLLHDVKNNLQEKLVQKDLELTEINQKCKFTENENIKLYSDLEAIKMKFDKAIHVNEEVEKRVCKLMEDNSHKDNEIANIRGANQMLNTDINTLGKELAGLRTNKQHLMTELTYEMKNYEEEVAKLWNDAHSSSIHVGIFEEKVLELIGECERLGIIVIVQRKVFEEQIILSNAYTAELMQKLEPLESGSEKLRAQLNAYLPLVLSLRRSIASLGGQILSLLEHHGLENDLVQGSSLVTFDHDKSSQQHSEDLSKTETDGVLELQKLQLKVEELHKALEDYWGILSQENPDVHAISAAIITDIEVITPGKSLGEEEIQENRCTVMEFEVDGQETGKHLELQSGGSGSSKGTCELMMKDIQLDDASYDVETGTEEISRNGNQVLELWATPEKDVNNQVPKNAKSLSIIIEEDMDYHQTEVVEEEKPRYLSKIAAEKEVAVDNLVAPRKIKDSHQDWNKKTLECLASDAQRLSVLNKSVQELKQMLENSEKKGPPTNMKYDSVRWQLRETEETISHLFDMNNRLTKKAEDCRAASGISIGEPDEVMNQKRRRVSDRARKASEKIGRLELELQRIQYVLLKLTGEQESRTRAANRRSKVILRDYLYGKRESDKRKKSHFCGCVQTKSGYECLFPVL